MKTKTKPFPFQREDLEKIENWNGNSLIAWDMGCGKTFESLWFQHRNVTGTVVVVCPAVVKIVWAREAEKHFGKLAIVLHGRTPHRLTQRGVVYVVNYDILWGRGRSQRAWVDELKRLKPELVVFDELHYLKEGTNKRSRACRELAEGVKYKLGLSGTPIISRPIELWFPLSIIAPGLFPSRWHFGLQFCAAHRGPWGWDFTGASNLDVLNGLLTTHVMCRRLKKDVLKDLPPKTRQVTPLELPPAAMRDYREAVSDFIAWLMKRSKAKAMRALMADAMLKIGYLKRLAAQHKLPLVIDWVRNYLESGDQKLIVFGVHYFMLRDGIFPAFKDRAVLITGQITGAARQAALDRFNGDPSCRLLVGNIQAAGVGWSCTSADTVAFAELDWTPGNHVQAEDRVSGISRGTGRPVTSHWLVAQDTLEVQLCERLQSRADVIARALDGQPGGDLKLFNYLVDVLKQQGKPTPKRRKMRT